MNARKKGIILSYIFMMLEMISSIFFTPFLIKSFGQAEYGVYSLVNTITSYLYLLDLGIGNSIVRYMSKYRVKNDSKKMSELLAVTLAYYSIIGLLVIVIGMLLVFNFDRFFGLGLNSLEIKKAQSMFMITMINAAITLAISPINKTLIAFERFAFSKISDIFKIIIRVSVSILVLLSGGRAVAIVTVNLFMTVCFGIVSIIYHIYFIKIKPAISGISLPFIKEIFSYSSIVFIQIIATQLNDMVDQIMIGAMVKSSAIILGIYAVGIQIVNYTKTIASSVNSVLMPGIVRMIETGADTDKIETEMAKIGRVIFGMLSIIYIIFLLFGKDFMILWAGNENIRAYYVAVIIMLPIIFIYSQTIGSQILWAMDKHKIQAILQISVACANIILTGLLIKWNPLFGASIATAITYIVGNILIQNYCYHKYIGISMMSFYKKLLIGTLPCLLISFVVGICIKQLNLTGFWGLIVNCGSMFIIYITLMYFKGFNNYEKTLINNLLNKIFKGALKNVQK